MNSPFVASCIASMRENGWLVSVSRRRTRQTEREIQSVSVLIQASILKFELLHLASIIILYHVIISRRKRGGDEWRDDRIDETKECVYIENRKSSSKY
jgi:hypothetical protein